MSYTRTHNIININHKIMKFLEINNQYKYKQFLWLSDDFKFMQKLRQKFVKNLATQTFPFPLFSPIWNLCWGLCKKYCSIGVQKLLWNFNACPFLRGDYYCKTIYLSFMRLFFCAPMKRVLRVLILCIMYRNCI